jgi:hypothetical protein
MTDKDKAPLDKFEEFVSEILTVTKDEMEKLKAEERAVRDAIRERDRALPDDAEPC